MMLTALAFHAEKLHDDLVYQRVKRIAEWLSRFGKQATFFVYPFRAEVVNQTSKVIDRVRYLDELGHEIGQHTHFCAGKNINKTYKRNDLSKENIRNCIRRDFLVLKKVVYIQRVFSAEAWIVNEIVLSTLIELGFFYDCSARFQKGKNYKNLIKNPNHMWLSKPKLWTNEKGQLVLLPTTCSLGEWFRGGWRLYINGNVLYRIVYLHHYDLLSLATYFGLWFFLVCGSRRLKCVSSIGREMVWSNK